MGGRPPPIRFFSNPLPPSLKLMPHGAPPPPLKNEAPPSEKQTPILKSEIPFQEMIHRKNTIKT